MSRSTQNGDTNNMSARLIQSGIMRRSNKKHDGLLYGGKDDFGTPFGMSENLFGLWHLLLVALLSVSVTFTVLNNKAQEIIECPHRQHSVWLDSDIDMCIVGLGVNASPDDIEECHQHKHGDHQLRCLTNEGLQALVDAGHCQDVTASRTCDNLGHCTTTTSAHLMRDGAGNLICGWGSFMNFFKKTVTIAKSTTKAVNEMCQTVKTSIKMIQKLDIPTNVDKVCGVTAKMANFLKFVPAW